MKKCLAFLFLMVVSGLAACSGSGVAGNGDITTDTRTVAAFDKVNASGALNVMISTGSHQKVSVTTDSNLLDDIQTSVSNNTLYIKTNAKEHINPSQTPVVTLYLPRLADLITAGAVRAKIDNLNDQSLTVQSTGSSQMFLRGKMQNLTISIAGAANMNAIPLEADAVTIKIIGAGNVKTYAVKTLNVSIAGAGTVLYAGNPVITQDVSGVGKILKFNSDAK